MAAEFLATHGIDLDAEMSKVQFDDHPPSGSSASETKPTPTVRPSSPSSPSSLHLKPPQHLTLITSVLLPTSATPSTPQDIHISPNGHIAAITPSHLTKPSTFFRTTTLHAPSTLALPALASPHLHLDKAHLHSHPAYADLKPQSGTFSEALALTTRAKERFTHPDLLERGNWLLTEAVTAGCTTVRAFVEVDAGVELKCLEVGLELKRLWEGRCDVQLCVFAQDPLFSGEKAEETRALVKKALEYEGVGAVGSTPYVEGCREDEERNVEWIVRLAREWKVGLDLHLDYHLDAKREALVWWVLEVLRKELWRKGKTARDGSEMTVCLGHCTRLTLFSAEEWERLMEEVQNLPVYFVGLPTSDLFMMGRPGEGEEGKDRQRGTLQLLHMAKKLGLRVALGVNNVGNAFTPWGSADPLGIAGAGVGVYQDGTAEGADMLYRCVSTGARRAIGLGEVRGLELKVGDKADFTLYGTIQEDGMGNPLYRRRRTVQDIVCDAGEDRIVIKNGRRIF